MSREGPFLRRISGHCRLVVTKGDGPLGGAGPESSRGERSGCWVKPPLTPGGAAHLYHHGGAQRAPSRLQPARRAAARRPPLDRDHPALHRRPNQRAAQAGGPDLIRRAQLTGSGLFRGAGLQHDRFSRSDRSRPHRPGIRLILFLGGLLDLTVVGRDDPEIWFFWPLSRHFRRWGGGRSESGLLQQRSTFRCNQSRTRTCARSCARASTAPGRDHLRRS
jgi:hypothetical protein